MSDLSSLYWIARCDGCGRPITAHAMSVLREAMLCLDCLNAESQAIAAQRGTGRIVMLAAEVSGAPRLGEPFSMPKPAVGGLGR